MHTQTIMKEMSCRKLAVEGQVHTISGKRVIYLWLHKEKQP